MLWLFSLFCRGHRDPELYSLLYFASNIVVGAVTAKRVEACSAAPLSRNYWEEMLSVLSVSAVGCG